MQILSYVLEHLTTIKINLSSIERGTEPKAGESRNGEFGIRRRNLV